MTSARRAAEEAAALGAVDRHRDAEVRWRAAVALEPGVAAWRVGLARCLRHSGDRVGALAEARRAVTLDPDGSDAHRCLAQIALWADPIGLLDEARRAADRAVRLAPGDERAWYLKTEVHLAARLWPEARDAARQAHELSSGQGFHGLVAMARVAQRTAASQRVVRKGNRHRLLDEAAAYYRRALDTHVDDRWVQAELAWVEAARRNRREALRHARHAGQLGDTTAAAHLLELSAGWDRSDQSVRTVVVVGTTVMATVAVGAGVAAVVALGAWVLVVAVVQARTMTRRRELLADLPVFTRESLAAAWTRRTRRAAVIPAGCAGLFLVVAGVPRMGEPQVESTQTWPKAEWVPSEPVSTFPGSGCGATGIPGVPSTAFTASVPCVTGPPMTTMEVRVSEQVVTMTTSRSKLEAQFRGDQLLFGIAAASLVGALVLVAGAGRVHRVGEVGDRARGG
ncbi:MAG: hypothetical protein MUF83_03965 [Acidimicrobiales bacterium]|nr:hypothetical protein [Acidimicrobiales bacterium]